MSVAESLNPDEVETVYQSLNRWAADLAGHGIYVPPEGVASILHLVVKNLIHDKRQEEKGEYMSDDAKWAMIAQQVHDSLQELAAQPKPLVTGDEVFQAYLLDIRQAMVDGKPDDAIRIVKLMAGSSSAPAGAWATVVSDDCKL